MSAERMYTTELKYCNPKLLSEYCQDGSGAIHVKRIVITTCRQCVCAINQHYFRAAWAYCHD
jgi:hypothetical protein